MNKYQEACRDILHHLTMIYEDYGIDYRDEFEILEEAVDKSVKYDELQKVYFNNEPMESADLNAVKLQELYDFNHKLIDKETPKRVIKFTSEITNSEEAYSFYTCPKCRMLLSNDVYCPKCGQRIDWSEEDE